MWLHSLKLISYAYAILTLLPKSWQRIRRHAHNAIEEEKNRRKKLKEATQVAKKCTKSDTPALRKTKSASQVPNESTTVRVSSQANSRTGKFDSSEQGTTSSTHAKYSVSRIANDYERKAHKQRVHVASPLVLQKRHTMSFFEGFKVPPVKEEPPSSNGLTDETSNHFEPSLPDCHQHNNQLSASLSDLPNAKDDSDSGQPLDQPNPNTSQSDVIRRRKKSQVDTVEEILLQQRFSRSLSSYSISDLLKDQPPDPFIDQIINEIH